MENGIQSTKVKDGKQEKVLDGYRVGVGWYGKTFGICPFTGKSYTEEDIKSGKVNFEHILPNWLCDRAYNNGKPSALESNIRIGVYKDANLKDSATENNLKYVVDKIAKLQGALTIGDVKLLLDYGTKTKVFLNYYFNEQYFGGSNYNEDVFLYEDTDKYINVIDSVATPQRKLPRRMTILRVNAPVGVWGYMDGKSMLFFVSFGGVVIMYDDNPVQSNFLEHELQFIQLEDDCVYLANQSAERILYDGPFVDEKILLTPKDPNNSKSWDKKTAVDQKRLQKDLDVWAIFPFIAKKKFGPWKIGKPDFNLLITEEQLMRPWGDLNNKFFSNLSDSRNSSAAGDKKVEVGPDYSVGWYEGELCVSLDKKRINLLDFIKNKKEIQALHMTAVGLTKLPDMHNIRVLGDFSCAYNNLENLDNSPARVDGLFNCRNCHLVSLSHAPAYVGGDFRCWDNNLENLDGGPKYVGGYFEVHDNKLTTLRNGPEYVGAAYLCYNNKLVNLDGAPRIIRSDFICSDNRLETLNGAPDTVDGDFECRNNKLKNLTGARNMKVKGFFDVTGNDLESFEGGPKKIGGDFYFSYSKKLKSLAVELAIMIHMIIIDSVFANTDSLWRR